ncbi:hypothetical protein C8Q75DRAFT_227410 [Abortiporus biennis]|nr:hypothetical protein C8Q75DRAFT_227410 [Abortiporus biennis]
MEDGLTPVEERHALAIELLNMAFREEEVFKTLSILPLDSDRLSILLPAILLTVQTLCYTCMYLKRNDLAYKIVEQVIRKQRYIFELEFTRLLLMPFLDFIHSYNTTHPSEPGIPGVQELQASIIYRMFDEIISSSQRWTESQVSSEEFTSVMRSILEQSGPKALATLINSKMTSISRGPEHYIELVADSLANALEDYTSPPRTAEDLQSLRQLIPSVLKVYVDNLRIDSLEVAEEAVTYCFDTDPNGLSGLEYLVGQIFSPPLVEHSSIRSSLVPLVAHIREIGESWEMLDVLAPVFQSIMLLFIQHCLGSKPPDLPPILLAEAKKWTCDCRFCKSIREWLVEKFVVNERTSLLVSGDKVAAHVLRFLSSHCTAVATWKDISNYSQRYHELETSNLEITKKDILYKLQQWQINRDQGLKLLEQISPHEEEQFKLLVEHFLCI